MLTSHIPPQPGNRLRSGRRRATGRLPRLRPRLEVFEDRVLLSTVTWDGGGGTSNWSDRFNWQDDVAPVPGDDLVFPDGAAQLTNFNNFPSGTSFHSLKFTGSGYTISGGSLNEITVDALGAIINRVESGTNRYNGPIQLNSGLLTIAVDPGSTLELGGAIRGSGGLSIGGGGTLTLTGTEANTYTGTTLIIRGLLQLDKNVATGASTAIPGDLKIVAPSTPNDIITVEVRLLRDTQIDDHATVTITQTTGSLPLLDLNSFIDGIGALKMTGGKVDAGFNPDNGRHGILIANGDVTAQAAQLESGTFAAAVLDGQLTVNPGHEITVNKQPGSPLGFEVGSFSGGPGLIKDGAGPLTATSGPSGADPLVINSGAVSLGGLSFLRRDVILKNDGVLRGDGFGGVVGTISTQDGMVRTLDDPILSGSPVSRWATSTGRGFGNDFSSVGTSTAAGVQTASWVFSGLSPGLYRVFGSWPSGANRSTRAPFSILDGSIVRSMPVVNQEQAPGGGPHSGGVVFQQLGGTVNVTSGLLTVNLSNRVPDESNGALVIADAIRIERLAGTLSPGGVDAIDSNTVFQIGTNGTLGAGSTYQASFVNTGPGANFVVPLDVFGSFDSVLGSSFTPDTLLTLSASSFSPPNPGTAFRIINRGGTARPLFDNAPDDGDTIELVASGQRHIFTINYHAGDGNDVDLIYQNTATQARDLKLSPDVIPAGRRVTLSGALTDPNPGDRLTLRVNWGDGTAQTFRRLGTRPFRLKHTYAHGRRHGLPYRVRVTWFDQHRAGNSSKLFVTVNNVAP